MDYFIEGALVLLGLGIIVFILFTIGQKNMEKKEEERDKKMFDDAYKSYWEQYHEHKEE